MSVNAAQRRNAAAIAQSMARAQKTPSSSSSSSSSYSSNSSQRGKLPPSAATKNNKLTLEQAISLTTIRLSRLESAFQTHFLHGGKDTESCADDPLVTVFERLEALETVRRSASLHPTTVAAAPADKTTMDTLKNMMSKLKTNTSSQINELHTEINNFHTEINELKQMVLNQQTTIDSLLLLSNNNNNNNRTEPLIECPECGGSGDMCICTNHNEEEEKEEQTLKQTLPEIEEVKEIDNQEDNASNLTTETNTAIPDLKKQTLVL